MAAAKKSILLIDDDPLVLKTLTLLLEKAGYFVLAFQSSAHAIQETLQEDFDLVITDIKMPEISGIQTIRYMREQRKEIGKSQVPEILITGYAEEYLRETEALKPSALVHKPIELVEFLEVVKRCFEG